jgi:hypothetical protein
MIRRRSLLFLVVGLVLLGWPAVRADEPASKEEPSKPAAERAKGAAGAEKDEKAARKAPTRAPKPRVYTNEDLERLAPIPQQRAPIAGAASPADGEPDDEARPAEDDPLRAMERQQSAAWERKRQLARAEREVSDAEARVRELEQRVLAIRNPLLPRPQLSPEEAEAWRGLSNPERLEMTQLQLDEVKARLEESRKRRDGLRD